jgi:hypothetical protein
MRSARVGVRRVADVEVGRAIPVDVSRGGNGVSAPSKSAPPVKKIAAVRVP